MKDDLLKIISFYGVMPQLKYFQSEIFEMNEAIIKYENIPNGIYEHIKNEYKENEDYVRNYAYQYGNNILDIRWIPLLVKNKNRKNYELF